MKIEINGKDAENRSITVTYDKYGIGRAVEAVALLSFCAFFMLFCGECAGCVEMGEFFEAGGVQIGGSE